MFIIYIIIIYEHWSELTECMEWVIIQDASELWPDRVRESFQKLKEDLKLG